MSIYKKLLLIRQSLPNFTKDREVDGVRIISDEQMNQALVPLLNDHGIITIPHGVVKESQFELEIEFVDTEDDSKCSASMSFPISHRDYHFGATATLTEKYLYKMLFKIHTGEDGLGKSIKETREDAFKDFQTIKPSMVAPQEKVDPPSFTLTPTTPEEADDLESIINQVNQEENIQKLEVLPPEKKEPEPDLALQQRINDKEWSVMVELQHCLSEAKAVEALDRLYKSKGTALYGLPDNEMCPINVYKVIDSQPRRSNAKIRNCIIQYRVFGEEAFWKQIVIETGLKNRAEVEALLTLPPPPVEPEIKPVIHDLKLDFEIPEHMGTDRDEEICFRLLANLRKYGVNQFAILYGLKNMENKPEIDMNGQDDDIIVQFLSKASKLQIIEMIKIAKSAG